MKTLLGVTSIVLLYLVTWSSAQGFLRIKDGYFFDPKTNSPWFAKGLSSETLQADDS